MSLYTSGRRSNGTNPRAHYGNKWAVRAWKRKRRELGLKRPNPLMTMDEMKTMKVKRNDARRGDSGPCTHASKSCRPVVAE